MRVGRVERVGNVGRVERVGRVGRVERVERRNLSFCLLTSVASIVKKSKPSARNDKKREEVTADGREIRLKREGILDKKKYRITIKKQGIAAMATQLEI